MASIYLQATINGKVAGALWQDQQGIAHFAYDPSYHGAPLSIALPLKNRSFHNTELLPYLFGLLPDSERQRSAIAREFGIRPNNAIAMLEHIGLDCPGGVQFFPLSQNTRSPCALNPCETMMTLHGWERMRAGRSAAIRANSHAVLQRSYWRNGRTRQKLLVASLWKRSAARTDV